MRHPLRIAVAALVVGILVGAVAGRQARPSLDRRPDQNVLLITIDTLRADAMSSSNVAKVRKLLSR